MQFFEPLVLHPVDPIFGLQQSFEEDPRENKTNLIIGVYLHHDLKPYILKCVKEAEQRILVSAQSKNYLPIGGDPDYLKATKKLVFGQDHEAILAVQTVGGTGALAIGGRLAKEAGIEVVGISSPSWLNHHAIFDAAGLSIHEYPYYSYEEKRLDFGAMMTALSHLPEKSLLLLQPTCHNPTGNDLSQGEWEELFTVIKERSLLPFFDCAYQGFGHGIEEDVVPLRLLAKENYPFLVSVSHSKNFGLYCERTGALLVHDPGESKRQVLSNLKSMIRSIHSNSPAHGSLIVKTLLEDDQMRRSWEEELGQMRQRIQSMRHLLYEELRTLYGREDHPFSHIKNQVGMFSYTGLDGLKVERLKEEFALFMPRSGRINVAGLNASIIPQVAQAFKTVME